MGDVLFVRSVERITDLDTVSNGLGNGQGPLKGNPFDEFHDRVIRTNVVECADIGMIQRRNRLRLMLEAFGELRRRNLDRDVAPQARVVRPVNLSHSTGAERREDFIRAESGSGCEAHPAKRFYSQPGEPAAMQAFDAVKATSRKAPPPPSRSLLPSRS
jgi:hypothetical protein